MHLSSHSRSPLSSGGNITRAAVGPHNDTAQPSLTSGFGAVIEKEHELQSATEGHLGEVQGPRSANIDRVLRHHQTQLAANVALLEQRYEMLPHPERFQALQGGRFSLARARHVATPESIGALLNLVARHRSLRGDIDALVLPGSDGQRGELILAEVGRNHEDMAWMLTALIEEDHSVRDLVPTPIIASVAAAPASGTNEARWENEGGATRATRAPMPAPPIVGPQDLAA